MNVRKILDTTVTRWIVNCLKRNFRVRRIQR